ncbi:hypothetical protein MWU59_04970 [Flavobacteriaceae bacterium F08102]|nr:hypothetical protein [Flavobacteriaceae bacterium F08102]
MKKQLILFLSILTLHTTYSQDCKVLLKTINETYEGECKKGKANGKGSATGIDTYVGEFKKGLPHGIGTYTWKDGRIYEGSFVKGKKEGKGKLTIKTDSIITGYWNKDTYVGLFEKPYKKISKSQNVADYSLRKIQDDINNLRFYVKTNQEQVKYPRLTIIVISGQYQTQLNSNDFLELTNVTYPIRLKASYGQDFIEVEIFQSGLWEIKTDITYIKGLN